MIKLLSYSKISSYNKCPASAYASELTRSKVVTKIALHRLGLPMNTNIEILKRKDTEATVYGKIGHELLQTKLIGESISIESILSNNSQYEDFVLTPKKRDVKKKFQSLVDITDAMIESLSKREEVDIFNGVVEQHWEQLIYHGYIDYIIPSTGKIVDFKFLSEAQTFEGDDWWKPYELQAQIYFLLNFMENETLVPVLYQAYIKKTKEILYHEFKYDIKDVSHISEMLGKEYLHISRLRRKSFLWRCDHPFCQYCRQTREIVYRKFYPKIGLEHLTS